MALEAERTVRINFIADGKKVGSVLRDLDGKLRDVKGRFVSAGRQAELMEEQVRQAAAAGVKGFARVAAKARLVQKNIKGAVKSGSEFITRMKNVGLIGLGFSSILSVGREVVEVLDELATEALEVEQVSRNLAFGIDEAAEATEGLVDNMTLARNANKAFALGVAKDSAEFASLVGAATKIAQVQGIAAQKLVEQAVVGIGRKSAARLDDLGILLSQNKAERIYAASLGTTAGQLSVLQKEEAFQKAALIEIQKAGDRAAASIDGFALTVAKGKIELQNSKQGFLGFDDSIGKVRETLRGLTEEELVDIQKFGEFADEGSESGKRLNKTMERFGLTLVDVRVAADDVGVSFQDLLAGQIELRKVQAVESTIKGLEALNQEAVKGLKEQSAEAEFQAKLGEARGESQKLINLRRRESLELARDAAELQFAQTASVKDEAALLAANRSLELSQVKKKKTGAGPSRAARVLAQGEQRVAQLEEEAKLAQILAKTDAERFAAEEVAFDAARDRLGLENEALEATRARGKFAKLELDNKSAALEVQRELLDAEQDAAAQERANDLVREAVALETRRGAAAASATGNVLSFRSAESTIAAESLERQAAAAGLDADRAVFFQARNEATELQQSALARAGDLRLATLAREAEAERLLFEQREAEILARPVEQEFERIERRDALAQLGHDRALSRLEQENQASRLQADLRQRLHEDELDRIEEKKKRQKAAIDFSGSALKGGFALAGKISAASIRDEDKRARHALRVRGIESIAIGALETVKMAAAFASFNIPEGVLHGAAAALAFAQGGIMLAGNLPGKGSASTGGAAAAPRAERGTSDAATIVESVPAADRQPGRQPTSQQAGGGKTVIIEGDVNAMGSIDRDFTEALAIELNNVGNGLEAA